MWNRLKCRSFTSIFHFWKSNMVPHVSFIFFCHEKQEPVKTKKEVSIWFIWNTVATIWYWAILLMNYNFGLFLSYNNYKLYSFKMRLSGLKLNSDCGFYVLQNVRCILHPEMGQKNTKTMYWCSILCLSDNFSLSHTSHNPSREMWNYLYENNTYMWTILSSLSWKF